MSVIRSVCELMVTVSTCTRRYIDTQHCKVMQDIVSSKLYKEQFDAIQECFRNIGFTEEVRSAGVLAAVLFPSLLFFFFLFQEVNSVYRVLSAILNTGNIEFAAITSQHQTDKSEVPNSEALENGEMLTMNIMKITNSHRCRLNISI